MPDVFTPLLPVTTDNKTVLKRIEIPISEVEDVDFSRGSGYKGSLKLGKVRYDIYGHPCGLKCYCDAILVKA